MPQTSQEYRRAKLNQLINEKYDGMASKMARASGIASSLISQYRKDGKNNRKITPALIDKIAATNPGWCEISTPDPKPQAVFGGYVDGLRSNIDLLESKVCGATYRLNLMLAPVPKESKIFDELRDIDKTIREFKAVYREG